MIYYKSTTVWTDPAFSIPKNASLWGWYKFDEGEGTTIYNYAENGVEDLTWDTTEGDPTSKVWGVAGFGHNDTGAPDTNARVYASVARTLDYYTIAAFVRPKTIGTSASYWMAARIGHAHPNWGEFGWNSSSPYNWHVQCGLGDFDSGVAVTFNQWYFCVLRNAINGGAFQFLTRVSGGALTTLVDETNAMVNSSASTLMAAFGLNRVNYNMDGGDFWFYAGATDEAYLSDADLNYIYQSHKSRYEMT